MNTDEENWHEELRSRETFGVGYAAVSHAGRRIEEEMRGSGEFNKRGKEL